jgi:uncharacterized protein
MKSILLSIIGFAAAVTAVFCANTSTTFDPILISPNQPIEHGKAPGMRAKAVGDSPGHKTFAIVFRKDDDALSGLVDFAVKYGIKDAHFTGIGAVSGATLGWLDLTKKGYHPLPITEQSEVLSLAGDIAEISGTPSVHMHAVLGDRNGQTKGGHVWRLVVNPTLEVFLTSDSEPLNKKPDSASGMNLIDIP